MSRCGWSPKALAPSRHCSTGPAGAQVHLENQGFCIGPPALSQGGLGQQNIDKKGSGPETESTYSVAKIATLQTTKNMSPKHLEVAGLKSFWIVLNPMLLVFHGVKYLPFFQRSEHPIRTFPWKGRLTVALTSLRQVSFRQPVFEGLTLGFMRSDMDMGTTSFFGFEKRLSWDIRDAHLLTEDSGGWCTKFWLEPDSRILERVGEMVPHNTRVMEEYRSSHYSSRNKMKQNETKWNKLINVRMIPV